MDSEGINRWRQIGDALIDEINQGLLAPGDRLPSEFELAAQFGVARKTVRRALSSLRDSGLVRAEHGRGTFVTDKVLDFRISSRAFFEQNLLENARTPHRELMDVAEMPASAMLSEALGVEAGDAILRVVTIGKTDGVPVTFGRNYFPLARMPALSGAYREVQKHPDKCPSTADVLSSIGIDNLRRRSMRLRARPASEDEVRIMSIPKTEYIIETHVVAGADDRGKVLFAKGYYSSSRVEFVIGEEIFR